jgi:3-hydroxymyristoyl/3-hydroxydecanoyl-(acyl carrier protein) dehydratases
MNGKKETLLRLGPDVIQKLLPHRRPLLMVDRVESFTRSPVPSLRASRYISANEEVFAGHFPGLHLWPGIYTIEGMGQTANVLEALMALVDRVEANGGNGDELLDGLLALEAGYTLKVAPRDERLTVLLEKLSNPQHFMGMSILVNVKLLAPVFAGQRLDYSVRRTHTAGDLLRHEVEAEVDGRVVARGSMDSLMKVGAPIG